MQVPLGTPGNRGGAPGSMSRLLSASGASMDAPMPRQKRKHDRILDSIEDDITNKRQTRLATHVEHPSSFPHTIGRDSGRPTGEHVSPPIIAHAKQDLATQHAPRRWPPAVAHTGHNAPPLAVIDLTVSDDDLPHVTCSGSPRSPSSLSVGPPLSQSAHAASSVPSVPSAALHHMTSLPPQSPIRSSQITGPASHRPASAPRRPFHAVRVGWFPGVYTSKAEAKQQTMHHPFKERQAFASLQQAEEYLTEPSARTMLDRGLEAHDYGHVCKDAFMAFAARAFSKENGQPGVSLAMVAHKLWSLLRQAREDSRNDVNWDLQPLPQVLIQQKEEYVSQGVAPLPRLGLWSGALRPRKALVESSAAPTVGDHTVTPQSSRSDSCTAGSSGPAVLPASPPLCSCGVGISNSYSTVTCAGAECKTGTFHRACVGLVLRPVPPGWCCWQCRPKAPSDMRLPPPSSPTRSVPQRPVTPPPSRSLRTASDPPTPTAIPILRNEAEPGLHPEQARVVDRVLEGGNVFFTGSGGTGKSTVLKALVKQLKALDNHVDIVAPSGIAALNVGGMTIYAYAGWHPDSFKEPLKKFIEKSYGKNVRKRLCKTDVLVIDEISMVERDVLVRLDSMMREVRSGWVPETGQKKTSPHDRKLPFGGAQVVVTGE